MLFVRYTLIEYGLSFIYSITRDPISWGICWLLTHRFLTESQKTCLVILMQQEREIRRWNGNFVKLENQLKEDYRAVLLRFWQVLTKWDGVDCRGGVEIQENSFRNISKISDKKETFVISTTFSVTYPIKTKKQNKYQLQKVDFWNLSDFLKNSWSNENPDGPPEPKFWWKSISY